MKKLFLYIFVIILAGQWIQTSNNSSLDNSTTTKNSHIIQISEYISNKQPKLQHCPTAYKDLTALNHKDETYLSRYKNISAIYPQKRVVIVPVADLRFEPEAISPKVQLPTSDLTNPLQITQLLLGEYIMAYEEVMDTNNEAWLKVYAIQQEKFVGPSGWLGYPGWIKKNQTIEVGQYPACNIVISAMFANLTDASGDIVQTVSVGTRFQAIKINENFWKITLPNQTTAYIRHDDIYEIVPTLQESIDQLRVSIINKSKEFLGYWYSWGGRSAQSELFGNISSVDCSALVNLSFLAHGLQLPRMSKEQFLASSEIKSGANLQPGDLIFYASVFKNKNYKNPLLIDHIMIYLGDNQLIEATFADDHKIRITACDERVGKPCHDIQSGDIIKDFDEEYFVYFGTFFNDLESLQKLRDNALKNTYF